MLVEAEKLDTSNVEAARVAFRVIGDKWDAIGKVPRERSAELERRLRAVEKKVRDAADAGRVDPEAQARADQFRVRAEQFERQAEKAAAAGRTKDAEEARASAEQWRQWAEAAVQSPGPPLAGAQPGHEPEQRPQRHQRQPRPFGVVRAEAVGQRDRAEEHHDDQQRPGELSAQRLIGIVGEPRRRATTVSAMLTSTTAATLAAYTAVGSGGSPGLGC